MDYTFQFSLFLAFSIHQNLLHSNSLHSNLLHTICCLAGHSVCLSGPTMLSVSLFALLH
jgi:hypothetical protein